jgi:hypothetical protein
MKIQQTMAQQFGLMYKVVTGNLDGMTRRHSLGLPSPGGDGADGVSQGKLLDGPVNGWTIRDGKLHLNFSAELNGVFPPS